MNHNGFVLREADGLTYYASAAIEQMPGMRHGFSNRRGRADSESAHRFNLGRVSWDAPERVVENRLRFLAAVNLHGADLLTLSQIHSDRLHIIRELDGKWNDRLEGDAFATQCVGAALAVLVADCWPILIADPGTGAIAAVHAGWRGTLSRIVAKTIAGMVRSFGSDPGQLRIAIGPGIRACCFEVGPEVAAAFELEFPGIRFIEALPSQSGKYSLDLRSPIDRQLLEAGVAVDNISDLGLCTRCHPEEFFSYRGEGSRSGRMMAVIARVNS